MTDLTATSTAAPDINAILAELIAAANARPHWSQAAVQMLGLSAQNDAPEGFDVGTTLAVDATTNEPVRILFAQSPNETVILGELRPYGATRYRLVSEQSDLIARLDPLQFGGLIKDDEKDAYKARADELDAAAEATIKAASEA